MVLFCMGIMSGFAQSNEFTYTDDNGVTWGGYISFDYNYEDGTQTLQDVSINSTSSNNETEVVIPGEIFYDGKKYTVTSLGNVFSGNKIVEKVTIPKTVTNLNSTFEGRSALSEVVNTNQLKSVYGAFSHCTSLKSIDLSSCEILGSYSFINCTQLEGVVLKACKEIESCAFSNGFSCPKLKSVGDISHCESIGEYAFQECSSLTSVDLSSCKTIGKNSFEGCSALESVGSTKLFTNIPESAFSGCTNLQNIDLWNCTSIGSFAFYGCSKLNHLNLNKCTYISKNAFNGSGLEEIDLSAVKMIEENAFSDCQSLAKVTGLEQIKTLPSKMFWLCCKLSSIDLSKIESLGEDCMRGTAIDSVNLQKIKNWSSGVFANCEALTTVVFPDSLTCIPSVAFANCYKLSTIDLSHCTAIYSSAFEGCTSLVSVTLDSCQTLGDKVFYGCTSLAKITLPETVTNLGWACFDGSTIVTSMATVPPVISKNEYTDISIPMGEYVLVNVPKESLSSYKSANYWKDIPQFGITSSI